ncbi:MAG: peroxiredoxin family protein [Pseudomonadales bacterium]|nr:peroxiredoxin family protein [Pseudomonadales bacterium]
MTTKAKLIPGRLIVLLLSMGVTFSSLYAAESSRETIEVSTLGPQIGEVVPEFTLPDQNGNLHNLDSIMGPNGAMLLFHRSADW